jgi:hypothetical protein
LNQLGLSIDESTMTCIAKAEEFFSRLGHSAFDAMFIGTTVDETGVPSYGTLWFFNDQFIYNVPNFRNSEGTEYVILVRGSVAQCKIAMRDCDFDAISGRARMSVTYVTATNIGANMNAHGDNCLQLLEIAKRYLLPRPGG